MGDDMHNERVSSINVGVDMSNRRSKSAAMLRARSEKCNNGLELEAAAC